MSAFEAEVRNGERYGFGANWLRFLELVDEGRIERSTSALREALLCDSLSEKTFLDIGSGSGLSSLAALRLGARVTSFDYDSDSVECTKLIRERFANANADWQVTQGSVLDRDFLGRLPQFDVVYSWGVLHHTGDMYAAVQGAAGKVKPGGLFCIALYRRTLFCELWKIEKRFYSRASEPVKKLLRTAWVGKERVSHALRGRDFSQMVRDYARDARGRGMDYYRDIDDWLGGYPYESITPTECRDFVCGLGFELLNEKATGSGVSWTFASGCDEWLFRRKNT